MKKTFLKKIAAAFLVAIMSISTVSGLEISAVAATSQSYSSKLPAPKNISVSKTSNSIKVKWDAVKGADAYRVYLYNNQKRKFETYKNVSSTTCNITGLKPKTTYIFRIAALVYKNGKYVVQTKTVKYNTKTKAEDSSKNDNNVTLKEEFIVPTAGTSIKGIKDHYKTYNMFDIQVATSSSLEGKAYIQGEEVLVGLHFNNNNMLQVVYVRGTTKKWPDIMEEYKAKLGDDYYIGLNGSNLYWDHTERGYDKFMINGIEMAWCSVKYGYEDPWGVLYG